MWTSCRFCGHANPDSAKFCNECGAQLSLKPCPECEAVNAADAVSCYQCEHAFDELAVSAPRSSTGVANDGLSFRNDDAHVPETLAFALVAEPSARTESDERGSATFARTDGKPAPDLQTNGQDSPSSEADAHAVGDRETKGEDGWSQRDRAEVASQADDAHAASRDDRSDTASHDPRSDEASQDDPRSDEASQDDQRSDAASRDDRRDAATPDDAVSLHEDIRAFRQSLRQQQARTSYRAAGAALVVIALAATGYAYWSSRGSEGPLQAESTVKERSDGSPLPGKASGTAPTPESAQDATRLPGADAPTTSTANEAGRPVASTEAPADQPSRGAADTSSSLPETGSSGATPPAVTPSSKRGNGGTPARRNAGGTANDSGANAGTTPRRLPGGTPNDSNADAVATQRLISRDLGRFQSPQNASKPALDRDAIETKRLVDRDLAPFRGRDSRPPDRAFPDIN